MPMMEKGGHLSCLVCSKFRILQERVSRDSGNSHSCQKPVEKSEAEKHCADIQGSKSSIKREMVDHTDVGPKDVLNFCEKSGSQKTPGYSSQATGKGPETCQDSTPFQSSNHEKKSSVVLFHHEKENLARGNLKRTKPSPENPYLYRYSTQHELQRPNTAKTVRKGMKLIEKGTHTPIKDVTNSENNSIRKSNKNSDGSCNVFRNDKPDCQHSHTPPRIFQKNGKNDTAYYSKERMNHDVSTQDKIHSNMQNVQYGLTFEKESKHNNSQINWTNSDNATDKSVPPIQPSHSQLLNKNWTDSKDWISAEYKNGAVNKKTYCSETKEDVSPHKSWKELRNTDTASTEQMSGCYTLDQEQSQDFCSDQTCNLEDEAIRNGTCNLTNIHHIDGLDNQAIVEHTEGPDPKDKQSSMNSEIVSQEHKFNEDAEFLNSSNHSLALKEDGADNKSSFYNSSFSPENDSSEDGGTKLTKLASIEEWSVHNEFESYPGRNLQEHYPDDEVMRSLLKKLESTSEAINNVGKWTEFPDAPSRNDFAENKAAENICI